MLIHESACDNFNLGYAILVRDVPCVSHNIIVDVIELSQAMRKCVLCHMRTTKASAQSDQRLCCSLLR